MAIENALYPNKQQVETLLSLPDNGPVCMVNLLKFREKAEYEDGRAPAENDVFDDLHSTIPLERPLRMRACSPAPHRVRGLRP